MPGSDKVDVGGPSRVFWSCSFERSDNVLCGMTQERSRDQLDWIIQSGSTRSRDTGPDQPRHGYYYAYIEASERQPDDEAWSVGC